MKKCESCRIRTDFVDERTKSVLMDYRELRKISVRISEDISKLFDMMEKNDMYSMAIAKLGIQSRMIETRCGLEEFKSAILTNNWNFLLDKE